MPNPVLEIGRIGDLYVRNNFDKLDKFFKEQNQVLDFKFMSATFATAGVIKLFHGLGRIPTDLIRLSVTGPGIVTLNRSLFDTQYLVLSASDACRVRFLAGVCPKDPGGANFESAEIETWFASAVDPTVATGLMPTGTLLIWPSPILPEGYLWALNQTVSILGYPALYAYYGTTWNTGSEPTGQFRLPPAPGRVPMFAGTGTSLTARTLGQNVGEESHVLTLAELAAHDHGGVTGVFDISHTHNFTTAEFVGNSGIPAAASTNRLISSSQAGQTARSNTTGTLSIGGNHNHSITSAGSGTAHNNIQPSFVVNGIIKY